MSKYFLSDRAIATGALVATLLGTAPGASALETQTLSGHVPKATAALASVGRLPADKRLRLAIALPLRNRDSLNKLLADLYDPSSPRYHQYLSPEQFAAGFGPNESDYAALEAFAQAHNLQITARHSNRVLLDVSGTVAEIEKALHISLRLYSHPHESRKFFAPDTEPSLELNVPVLHISGLDDFQLPRPASLHRLPTDFGSGGTPLDGSGPGGLYRGNDFRHAYAPGVSLNGSGQMLGLVEFDYYFPADIATYRSQTGVAAVPLIDVFLDGAAPPAGNNNIEVALDIEVANAMAPGLAAIIVYDGGNGNDILNRMATDNLAKQLSASWTFPCNAATDQILQQFAAQGQSYFNSSGDAGAYTSTISAPADRPFVTSVGGTTLSTPTAGGVWGSETSWNWYSTGSGTSGTGGGVSTVYSIPTYQQGTASLSTNGGSTIMRNIPDVAMIGDATYVVHDNGQSGGVGGTSVSSPLWAAFTALINQQAVSFGRPTVGFLNPLVYAIGNGPGYATNFHDITTGNNTNPASPTRFLATGSYDLCTGWGSPTGPNTINTLAPRQNARLLVNAGTTLLSEGCSPGNSAIDPGETVTLNFSVRNIGGVKVTNLVATLQADSGVLSPNGPQTYGAINSGSSVSRSFTFTANGGCGSTLVATLQLQDGADNLGTLPFSFPLGKPTTVLNQNFDLVSAPALPSGWVSGGSGSGALWITSTNARDTSPNSAFAAESTTNGFTDLLSPSIPLTSSSAQISFRQNFNLESDPVILSNAFDGGVLEIKIGNGPFTDILAAGGSFATNGYNRSISVTNLDNPLSGRQCWSALSGGFITTVANLPSSAAGQSVQFRWRFGTDNGNFYGGTGWYVDSVNVFDGSSCCAPGADLAISHNAAPNPVVLGGNLTYTLAVSNLGPSSAASVIITDTLPANVTFVSASAGTTNSAGAVVCQLGSVTPGTGTNVSVVVTPLALGLFTNTAALSSTTSDPASGNNTSTQIAATMLPPVLAAPGVGGSGVSISVASVLGVNYRLEYKNSLSDPTWTPLLLPVAGSGGAILLQDTNAPVGISRFYRVNCSNGLQ
jgi:uncharacterized repeat protein (TIGR01451 family)